MDVPTENDEEDAQEDGDITGESEPAVEFSDFVVPTVAPPKDFAEFKPVGDSTGNEVFIGQLKEPKSGLGSSCIEVEAPVTSADDVGKDVNDSLA